jgi:hypothetical protein
VVADRRREFPIVLWVVSLGAVREIERAGSSAIFFVLEHFATTIRGAVLSFACRLRRTLYNDFVRVVGCQQRGRSGLAYLLALCLSFTAVTTPWPLGGRDAKTLSEAVPCLSTPAGGDALALAEGTRNRQSDGSLKAPFKAAALPARVLTAFGQDFSHARSARGAGVPHGGSRAAIPIRAPPHHHWT